MVLAHGFAYVGSFSVGAQVIDVRDPLRPRLLGSATFVDATAGRGIALHSNRLLMPGSDRIGVFELQCENSPLHAPDSASSGSLIIAPNPFNSSTTITLQRAQGGLANLDIYDVMGRRVRTLMRGDMSSGFHEVRWDGLDDSGVRVAPGVFFLRLEQCAQSQTGKLVLTR
jgi:hypothetical protein